MVKSRKSQPVVTALPASRPAVVPVVSALDDEVVPDKAPEPALCPPSTSDNEDMSRPVCVYADGMQIDECLSAESFPNLCAEFPK